MGSLAPWTRDRTCTPGIGRQTLNQWTAREVPCRFIFNFILQLILEQHRFELHRSTYTLTFFNSKYYNTKLFAVDWIHGWGTARTGGPARTEGLQAWGDSTHGGDHTRGWGGTASMEGWLGCKEGQHLDPHVVQELTVLILFCFLILSNNSVCCSFSKFFRCLVH